MRHCSILFTAVLLLLVALGVPVARGDDKPATKDLGTIQPPGGVPLDFGKPGMPIPVEAVERARLRLQAAPGEALEKWVAELERITGKKLESDLEQGGCSTYFVSRVSLAFVDDTHWNAPVAEKLFQRAQSMPAAEAEAWKAAFEALLKREVTPRPFAVPLVLIPVDALHEGEKYSPE